MTFDFDNSDELLIPGSAKWKAEVRKESGKFVEGMKEEIAMLQEAVTEFTAAVLEADVDDEQSLIRMNGYAHSLHVTFELVCGTTGSIVRKLYHSEDIVQQPPEGSTWN